MNFGIGHKNLTIRLKSRSQIGKMKLNLDQYVSFYTNNRSRRIEFDIYQTDSYQI